MKRIKEQYMMLFKFVDRVESNVRKVIDLSPIP